MHAIRLLREMHADSKTRLKIILGLPDPIRAASLWKELQPLLELHEQLEDTFIYTPVFELTGPGTPLGDWQMQHEADVATVQELVGASNKLDPATPEWRMTVAMVADTLNKHVMDEEGQIFGRIEQLLGPERLDDIGQEMAGANTSKKKAASRK